MSKPVNFLYTETGSNLLRRSGFRCGYFIGKRMIEMNALERSELIKAGLRKGFHDGSSKMAQRRCYGYTVDVNGKLEVKQDEAQIVRWIFEQYLCGSSPGYIASRLEKRGILSPTGKPKWNREAINKLLSNEKYTGRVLLQKTISIGSSQIENDGLMDRYLYIETHEAIISDRLFKAVQEEKQKRSKAPEKEFAMGLIF